MRKIEHDFLTWTSFPSSLRMLSDEPGAGGRVSTPFLFETLSVEPGKTLRVQFKAKQKDATLARSEFAAAGWNGREWVFREPYITLPLGSFDWTTFSEENVIPSGIQYLRGLLIGGGGEPVGTTWFDDLKIYQDDVLIYSNDFSNWDPLIGAGVGAGILGVVVPALVRVPEPGVAYEYQKPVLEKEPLLAAGLAGLGILVGGGIGLLTGMGIVPVPQIPIPTFGATPEEPGAPARLGKYLITG